MEGSTAESFFAAEGEETSDFALDHILHYERQFDEFGTPLLKRKTQSLEENDPSSRHGNGNNSNGSNSNGTGPGRGDDAELHLSGLFSGTPVKDKEAGAGEARVRAAGGGSGLSAHTERTVTATHAHNAAAAHSSAASNATSSAADGPVTPTRSGTGHSSIMRSPLSTFKLMSQTIAEYGDMIAQRRTEIAELQRANQLRLSHSHSAYPKVTAFVNIFVNIFVNTKCFSDCALLIDHLS
jgi:hypothetical protein